ncbi:MAG: hypothetical protein ACN6OP_19920, partial [Pseudomonadales bacterium]
AANWWKPSWECSTNCSRRNRNLWAVAACHPGLCPTSSDEQIVAIDVAAHELSAVGMHLQRSARHFDSLGEW